MCSRYDDPTTYDEDREEMLAQAIEAVDTVMEARPRCQAVVGHAPSPYGEISVKCGQVVGITRWTDGTGLRRASCSVHLAGMRSLWP